MVTDADLFRDVVVVGDPVLSDGTRGVLVDVGPALVVIETPPDASHPNGDQVLAAVAAVNVVAGDRAA